MSNDKQIKPKGYIFKKKIQLNNQEIKIKENCMLKTKFFSLFKSYIQQKIRHKYSNFK